MGAYTSPPLSICAMSPVYRGRGRAGSRAQFVPRALSRGSQQIGVPRPSSVGSGSRELSMEATSCFFTANCRRLRHRLLRHRLRAALPGATMFATPALPRARHRIVACANVDLVFTLAAIVLYLGMRSPARTARAPCRATVPNSLADLLRAAARIGRGVCSDRRSSRGLARSTSVRVRVIMVHHPFFAVHILSQGQARTGRLVDVLNAGPLGRSSMLNNE